MTTTRTDIKDRIEGLKRELLYLDEMWSVPLAVKQLEERIARLEETVSEALQLDRAALNDLILKLPKSPETLAAVRAIVEGK